MEEKGFTRDLTIKIKNLRNSYLKNSLTIPKSTEITANDAILHQSYAIEAQFSEIKSKLDSLDELYRNKLKSLPSFADEFQAESEISQSASQITKMLTRLKNQLKNQKETQETPEATEITHNLQRGYLERVRNLTIRFREMQSLYINRLNDIKSKIKAQSSEITDSIDDNENSVEFEDISADFTSSQNQMVIQNAEEIRLRNQIIEEAFRQLEEIKPLFLDLDTLIHEQGTVLDRIDHKIDRSLDEVKQGNEELMKGEKDQIASQKCFYIYLVAMLLLIIILGSIIIIKKDIKKKQRDQNNA